MLYQEKPQKLWLKPVLIIGAAFIFIVVVGLTTNWGNPAVSSTSEQSPKATDSDEEPATSTPRPTSQPTPRVAQQTPISYSPPVGEDWWDPYQNQAWVRQVSPVAENDYPCQYTWFSHGRDCRGKTVEIYIVLEGYFLNMWLTDGTTQSIPLPPGQAVQVFIPENLERAGFGTLQP